MTKEEKKMRGKRLLIIILCLIIEGIIGVMAPSAHAAASDTLTLNVTVTPSLDVTVYRTVWDFGTIGASVSSQGGTSTAVKNKSASAQEKYNLKASHARGSGVDWTLAAYGSETANQYSLCAYFNSARPTGDFSSTTHDLDTGGQDCNGTIFAGNQDGYDLAAGTQELLWFRIKTPSSVSSSGTKTIYVTITALNQS